MKLTCMKRFPVSYWIADLADSRSCRKLNVRPVVSWCSRVVALVLLWLVAAPAGAQTFTTLCSFNEVNGWSPFGSLAISGSTLYGTTLYVKGTGNNGFGYGLVFSLPASGGSPADLAYFLGSNGNAPVGALALSGSTLYGTTYEGGAYGNSGGNQGYGTVFSVPASGFHSPTVLQRRSMAATANILMVA